MTVLPDHFSDGHSDNSPIQRRYFNSSTSIRAYTEEHISTFKTILVMQKSASASAHWGQPEVLVCFSFVLTVTRGIRGSYR